MAKLNTAKFSAWLAEARSRPGVSLSQLELAGKLKVTKGRVSQWENGDIPPLDKLILLAEHLRVDVREPLTALGVLKDDAVEVTPDERTALNHLRALNSEGFAVALTILESLGRLEGGRATRKKTTRRTATGDDNAQEEAS